MLANKAPLQFQGRWYCKVGLPCSDPVRGAAASKSLEADVFRRVRFEATVGAGLPVIRTLQDLLQAGDTINAWKDIQWNRELFAF